MKVNITNTTNYDKIKFYIYYTYDNDGIRDYDKLWIDFYQIKNNDVIEFDLKVISIITLKVFVENDDDTYIFKYKYTTFGNLLNLKLTQGEKHPILKINNIKPDSRVLYPFTKGCCTPINYKQIF